MKSMKILSMSLLCSVLLVSCGGAGGSSATTSAVSSVSAETSSTASHAASEASTTAQTNEEPDPVTLGFLQSIDEATEERSHWKVLEIYEEAKGQIPEKDLPALEEHVLTCCKTIINDYFYSGDYETVSNCLTNLSEASFGAEAKKNADDFISSMEEQMKARQATTNFTEEQFKELRSVAVGLFYGMDWNGWFHADKAKECVVYDRDALKEFLNGKKDHAVGFLWGAFDLMEGANIYERMEESGEFEGWHQLTEIDAGVINEITTDLLGFNIDYSILSSTIDRPDHGFGAFYKDNTVTTYTSGIGDLDWLDPVEVIEADSKTWLLCGVVGQDWEGGGDVREFAKLFLELRDADNTRGYEIVSCEYWPVERLKERVASTAAQGDHPDHAKAMQAYAAVLEAADIGVAYKELEEFALFDVNGDGLPELLTHGGGSIDYSKIWTYQNGTAENVWFTTDFTLFEDGTLKTYFHSGSGEDMESYYRWKDDWETEQIGFVKYWVYEDTYAINDEAKDAPRVSYEEAQKYLDDLLEDANEADLVYHKNTAGNRLLFF